MARQQGFRVDDEAAASSQRDSGGDIVVVSDDGAAFAHDLIAEQNVIRQTAIELAILFVGSAIWMTAVAVWMGIRFIRDPIDGLVSQAQHIARGDFRPRAPLQGPDEVIRLATALATMASTLDESQRRAKELERHRHDDQRRWMRNERLATVGRLAAGITHELGTPLIPTDH